jgi:hypothetical protein
VSAAALEEHHPAKADDGNAVLRARARWASQSWTECPHYITSAGSKKRQIDPRIHPPKAIRN